MKIKVKETEGYEYYAGNGILNKPGYHSVAAYSYKIEIPPAEYISKYIDASFIIAGCNRNVELDLDLGTEEECANSMHKVDTLISALTQCKLEMEMARKEIIVRQNQQEENKKKDEVNKA